MPLLYNRQNTVNQLGDAAAPMLAKRSVSMGLAETDFNQHRHFHQRHRSIRTCSLWIIS
jgi:hypothetical protein